MSLLELRERLELNKRKREEELREKVEKRKEERDDKLIELEGKIDLI